MLPLVDISLVFYEKRLDNNLFDKCYIAFKLHYMVSFIAT